MSIENLFLTHCVVPNAAASGNTYYFNSETQESRWDLPSGAQATPAQALLTPRSCEVCVAAPSLFDREVDTL